MKQDTAYACAGISLDRCLQIETEAIAAALALLQDSSSPPFWQFWQPACLLISFYLARCGKKKGFKIIGCVAQSTFQHQCNSDTTECLFEEMKTLKMVV